MLDLLNSVVNKVEGVLAFQLASFPSTVMAFSIQFSILSAVLVSEVSFVGWKRSSLRRVLALGKSCRNDIFSYVMSGLGFSSLVAIPMTLGVFYALTKCSKKLTIFVPDTAIGAGLCVVLIFLLQDLFAYLYHRAAHRWGWLWAAHKYHHSASEMTVFTTDRVHPVEQAIGLFWVGLPLALVRVESHTVLLFFLALKVHGYLKHSNVLSGWGWIGRNLLVSPGMHRVHHGVETACHDCNFGDRLVIWDRMFGTLKSVPDIRLGEVPIGLSEDDGGQVAAAYWGRVCQDWWRATLLGLKSLVTRMVPVR